MPQVQFLPWAETTTPIAIGPVTITPWTTIRAGISLPRRQFLDKYFKRYRTTTNHAITNIGIVTITSNPLQSLTSDQERTVRRAIDALAFTSIAPALRTAIATGTTTGIPNTERYALITQRLTTFADPISIETRRISHITSVKNATFFAPWETGGTALQRDDEVLESLGKLLVRKRNAHLRDRLFRTIEWFRLSNTGNPGTSDETRLVMKTTAFEVLLEPGYQKRVDMTNALHALTSNKHVRERTIVISKKQYKVDEPAAWLDSAYKVRNKIIHGDKPSRKQFAYRKENHLDLADAVLYEAVIWELINHRLLGTSTRRQANSWARTFGSGTPTPDLIATMMSTHFQLDGYHKVLRWWKK